MRKFLPFLLLFAFTLPAQEDTLTRFLRLYYTGDYTNAHELIGEIYADTWKQQVWDERIHAQADIPGCPLREKSDAPVEGLALLRIGDFENARDCFDDDWLSQFGRAILADWEGHDADAQEAIRKAMALSPDNPDLLYFAANVVPSREMALDFFSRFLELSRDDPYRRSVAQYSIEFIQKTWDIPLNVPVKITGVEPIDSNYNDNQLVIQATINGKEKVSLILDTGAGGITLKEKDWHPQLTTDVMMIGIGKKQTSRSTRLVLNSFEAGRYQLKNPVAAVAPGMPLHGADGITGTAVFAYHSMLVPLKSGAKFTLFTCNDEDQTSCLQSSGIRFTEKITLPFYTINRLMILKGRIRNSPDNLDMMLDTGAERSIISIAAAKRYAHINYQLSNKSSISGVGGKSDPVLLTENVEVILGGIKKQFNQMSAMNLGESSEAMELELDMIVGRDFLQGYTLLIDYKHNRVTFLK